MSLQTAEVPRIERKEIHVCDADGCTERRDALYPPDDWTFVAIDDGRAINTDMWDGKSSRKEYCPKHKIKVVVE